MGGDSALDHLNAIVERIEGHFSYDDEELESVDGGGDACNVYTRELLEENMIKAVDYCNQVEWDSHIAWQVLGHMILRTGAHVAEEVKALVVDAAVVDEWANEPDEERAFFMRDLIEKIEAHETGKVTLLKEEALFQEACRI